MNLKEKLTLRVDQNPNGSYEEEVEGSLLVGEIIHTWNGGHDHYGSEDYYLRPAYYKGEKAFLKSWSWCPAPGYCASGEGESILTFDEGVKLLLKLGAYERMFQITRVRPWRM